MTGIKILLYHSVGEVDPRDKLGIRIDRDNFRKQMGSLKKNYKVWTLKEAVCCLKEKKTIPQKRVVITFDDGYKDNALYAAPIMEEFGFRATFFITVDYIGRVKTSPKRKWQRWECMDENDLKGLIDRGHDIGSHGFHHVDLVKLTKDEKRKEVASSKEKLSYLLNRKIDFFSYPYGSFDDELVEIVKDAGYEAACTTEAGANNHSTNLYRLKRKTQGDTSSQQTQGDTSSQQTQGDTSSHASFLS